MIQEALRKMVEREDLSRDEAQAAMLEIMDGQVSPTMMASFLVALRMKGETVDEITGFAAAMRNKMLKVNPKARPLVDTCGTGGDKVKSFNISTAAALVATGAGVAIAKHGNRAVSSACGSADVLETLGVKLDLTPQQVSDCIDEVGIGFMFAPVFHPAMKYAGPVRKEMGIRTVFNLLGPLANPANATVQLLGVYAPTLTEFHANALKNLGIKKALVVHGLESLDEVSTTGATQISTLADGKVTTDIISPEDVGIKKASLADLACGGSIQENADILVSILKGETGPRRDIVLLNASAVMVAADVATDLKQGLEIAAESIDSGKAMAKLEQLRDYTNSVRAA